MTNNFTDPDFADYLSNLGIECTVSGNQNLASESEENESYTSEEIEKVNEKVFVEEEKIIKEIKPKKDIINILACGHVDAGKSTLLGHLIHLLGHVNKNEMHKIDKESRRLKKKSFRFAWLFDNSETERSRGVTVNVGTRSFETDKKRFTLMDCPGHQDFVPNLLAEAFSSDAAILVVDCSYGNFESGFVADGQTKEHVVIVKGLGINKLIVAMNKMDLIEWSKERFNEVKTLLVKFLEAQQFKKVVYFPVSGLEGLNIIEKYNDFDDGKWPSFLEIMESLNSPKRRSNKETRFCVCSIEHSFQYGEVLFGKLVSGSVSVGKTLLVMPLGISVVVKAIQMDSESVETAIAGENIELAFRSAKGIIKPGFIICNESSPVPVINSFKAKIVTLKTKLPIVPGQTLITHIHNEEILCKVKKIEKLIDRKTGKDLKGKPKCLKGNSAAVVVFQSERKFCAETFDANKSLSRVIFRFENSTVAVGVVLEILT